jgi:hypothetical protein
MNTALRNAMCDDDDKINDTNAAKILFNRLSSLKLEQI